MKSAQAGRHEKSLQFARGRIGGFQSCVIKFCVDRKDFELEEALYAQPDLHPALPALIESGPQSDTSSSAIIKSKNGFVFPPFLVLERGMGLCECASLTVHTAFAGISVLY
jgi:hypothetical protein